MTINHFQSYQTQLIYFKSFAICYFRLELYGPTILPFKAKSYIHTENLSLCEKYLSDKVILSHKKEAKGLALK
jgi:hypothetical protein